MWTNWVEKAKDLAANLDQQLNESVGLETDPRLTVAAPSSSSASFPSVEQPQQQSSSGGSITTRIGSIALPTPSAIIGNERSNDDDDVWNDDFDVDVDDVDDGNVHDVDIEGVKATSERRTSSDMVVQPSLHDDVPPSMVPSPMTEASMEVVDMPVVPIPTTGQGRPPSPVVLPPAPTMEDEGTTNAAKPETTSTEAAGWDEDDHFDDNVDNVTLPDSGSPPLATSVAIDTTVAHEDDAVPHKAVTTSASTLFSSLAATASSTIKTGSSTTSTNAGTISTNDSGGPIVGRAGDLLSSWVHRAEGLAHKAEGLAHKAEGGVASLLTAASHLVEKEAVATDSSSDVRSDDDNAGSDGGWVAASEGMADRSSQPQPPVKIAPEPVAAIGVVTGLFASALGDGGEVSATEQPTNDPTETVDDTANEWDADDDLDVSENDGLEGPIVVQQVVEGPMRNDSDAEDPASATTVAQPDTTSPTVAEVHDDLQRLSTKPPLSTIPSDPFVAVTVSEETIPSSSPTPPSPTTATTPILTQQSPGENVQSSNTLGTATSILQNGGSASPPSVPIMNIEDDPRFQQLHDMLRLREDQLANKAEQLNQLQELMEAQESEYRQKLHDTKEEAKARIMRARERCEAAEKKLLLYTSSGADDAAKQEHIINELRAEGQALALKQATMEQAVRAAKGETRGLLERLDDETNKKTQALEKITRLETELKATKEALVVARKGESQSSKLENELLTTRSDAEMKANTILSLQQQIKELTAESKDLQMEIDKTRKSAAHVAQQEKVSMRREHQDLLADLETKLRTTEREAGVREDALRHEVAELRKRWQDAVRRADALSMDIQSSTAPLLRQLESMERQNRVRAANWTELENRLRSELEEAVIQNETLSKDRSEFKAKLTRLERSVKERDDDLASSRSIIEEQTTKVTRLETQMAKLESEAEKRQEEYEKVERLASEGVARVRSEMTQTVVDSEERYRGQIDKLEKDLAVEREKRSQLEQQVEQMLENSGMILAPQAAASIRIETKPKKLRQAEGQAEILAGALGLDDSDNDDADDDDDDDDFDIRLDRDKVAAGGEPSRMGGSINSYAALEQLSSRLKTAQVELESLRKSLRESQATRNSLVEELGETRQAKEKLPLFEAKVKELTDENRELEMEIRGLRDDIAEVRELYRTQLNVLLEEKAANNSTRPEHSEEVGPLTNGDDDTTIMVKA